MAARRSEQELYAVYLARVINIEAVQCHRAAATEEYDYDTAHFFSDGYVRGTFGDFQWSLDKPEYPWPRKMSVSLSLQYAWEAAVAAFKEFIAAIVNRELIASGTHPATGFRRELNPAEWTRTDLILDVRNGDLIEGTWTTPRRVLWSAITLRAAKQPRQKTARAHGYDWEGAWTYATSLRAEDQWDWKQHPRDKKQPLPAVHKTVEDKIKDWFSRTHKGRVPNISDIRQNITIPLYAGKRTRGKRKR